MTVLQVKTGIDLKYLLVKSLSFLHRYVSLIQYTKHMSVFRLMKTQGRRDDGMKIIIPQTFVKSSPTCLQSRL